jgi:pantoate kinase
MATPEVLVKKQIRRILNEEEVYYAMPIGTGYGNSGVPDFLVCCAGYFFGIEAKAGNNKPTTLQEDHLYRIRKSGGRTLVVNETNINELKELIQWMKKNLSAV